MAKKRMKLGNTLLYQSKKCVWECFFPLCWEVLGKSKKNRVVLFLILLAMTHWFIMGQIESSGLDIFQPFPIHNRGKIKIIVGGEKVLFPAEISITGDRVRITCQKDIFAPINRYDCPRSKELIIQGKDIASISIYKEDVIIFTRGNFFLRYAHLYIKVSGDSIFDTRESDAILLILDSPADIEERQQQAQIEELSRWWAWLTRGIWVLLGLE